MNMQKRICVINDISCEGRCSITAALPIYAAAGIHGNIIPTAVLSTQTGGYTGYTFRDLSGDMLDIARHFKKLELKFNVLYTGYLASERQIELVMEAADILNADTLIVDPVMGDGGRLYDGFSENYCEKMKDLCKKADVIVPNLTEACFLTGRLYGFLDDLEINNLLAELKALGPSKIVITGIKSQLSDGSCQIGIGLMDGDTIAMDFKREQDGTFHGAGDVFGAVLACGLAYGRSLSLAAKTAHEFTYDAIVQTKADNTDTRQGLNFEKRLKLIFEEYNS